MNAVTGLLVTPDGELHTIQVERPRGGGLDILGNILHCDPYEVTSINLPGWVQVWVDWNTTTPETSLLPKMLERLGVVPSTQGSFGLFLATVPNKWEVVGLNPEQEHNIREAWKNA